MLLSLFLLGSQCNISRISIQPGMIENNCLLICQIFVVLSNWVGDIAAKGGGYGDDYYRGGRGGGIRGKTDHGTDYSGPLLFEKFGTTGGVVCIIILILFFSFVIYIIYCCDCRQMAYERKRRRRVEETDEGFDFEEELIISPVKALSSNKDDEDIKINFESNTCSSKWISEDGVWKKATTEDITKGNMVSTGVEINKEEYEEIQKYLNDSQVFKEDNSTEIKIRSEEKYVEILKHLIEMRESRNQIIRVSQINEIEDLKTKKIEEPRYVIDNAELRRAFFESK